MEVEDDYELQAALALSLQEFTQAQGQHHAPSAEHAPGTIAQIKPPSNNNPTTAANKNPASTSAPAGNQRRSRKPAQFNPSESEVERSFRELTSQERNHISIPDLIKVGKFKNIQKLAICFLMPTWERTPATQ